MVIVLAEDGRVGLPSAPTPVADTSYVTPGFRPVMGQVGVLHTIVIGAPPPNGVTVTVYGPDMPGRGETVAEAVEGPVGDTLTDGDLHASIIIFASKTGAAGKETCAALTRLELAVSSASHFKLTLPQVSPWTASWRLGSSSLTGCLRQP